MTLVERHEQLIKAAVSGASRAEIDSMAAGIVSSEELQQLLELAKAAPCYRSNPPDLLLYKLGLDDRIAWVLERLAPSEPASESLS